MSKILISQEVYASILEASLNYPINNSRLIEFSQSEFAEMSHSLLNFTTNNKNLNQFIKLELDKSFFLVMEINSNGKRFNDLNHKKYFSGKNSKEKLLQLGQVIAFEIFCNNFARSPLNWNEHTFFSNLIFYNKPNSNGWYFSIIHSNVNRYNDSLFSRGYREQINRLKLLLFSIFQNQNHQSQEIRKMKDFLSKVLHINLPSSSHIYLQRGIVIGVESIVSNISFTMLESAKQKIKNLIIIDTQNNQWKNGINSIYYCPFLLDVLNDFVLDYSNFKEKKIKINLIL
ncbi:hypothetical protein DICPUDRAFT_99462 [Dictyostelium purpureum]|uniref:Actin-fragmin kinase catalytic domain-containing protein n=1 Tax=Dictyostelium purpureum TaxID=5786 RepID=F0ZZD5_DICPU|nr:uncharacterized protein DICPUDRAFT_99462 [Dictyostelium purpureum]EGC30687.1 hypothetical protein DICPUDRAFT_99462 [Dictyostelium purpureum]|eukprot:XP_003292785.1 hypothetical protein DICPUDRAFT_99462 [Dictyostelium purpureum]